MRENFEEALRVLNNEVIKMGAIVERAINNSIYAFKNYDIELAKKIMAGDREIDTLERDIEAKSLNLILRQQPVAKDLREVSTALKLVTDMERIGDHASDICETLLEFPSDMPEHSFNTIEHIPEMAKKSVEMVHSAVTAWAERDVDMAMEVIKSDDILDELFEKVKGEIVGVFKNNPEHIDCSICHLMIAKYFERIGDHAVNICEWVKFCTTGTYKDERIL